MPSSRRPGPRLTAGDVGRRVTVRRVLRGEAPLPDGRAPLGDVVGVLELWGVTVRIRRADGTVVTVAEDDVVLGRVVGEGASRRRDANRP